MYQLGGKSKTTKARNQGMNPFQYWYNSNDEVSSYMEQYFLEHIDLIPGGEIRTDCEIHFSKGTVHEKAQVLTLLSAYKLIFG